MYNLAIKKSDSVLYFEEISCAKKKPKLKTES